MRHRIAGRNLGRTTSHRKAMFRNMVTSLLEKERIRTTLQKAKEARRIADSAAAQLGGINGVIVEHKGPSVSLHYRATVDQAAAALAIERFLDVTPGVDAFVRLAGKMLVDLRPAIEVDKGTALSSVVASEDLSSVLVLGDDTTDVDAFLALRHLRDAGRVMGLAIAVRSEGTPVGVLEAADYTLASTEAVEHFLTWLAG